MRATINFELRESKKDVKGESPIYFRISCSFFIILSKINRVSLHGACRVKQGLFYSPIAHCDDSLFPNTLILNEAV